MKFKYALIPILIFCFSCNKDFRSEKDTPLGVVDALWQSIDKIYVYINFKNLDMEDLRELYLAQVSEDTTDEELFEICTDLLFELRDEHCFLNNGDQSVRFETAEGFDVFFDLEMIKENYIQSDLEILQYTTTGMINDSIAYLHLSEFEDEREFQIVMNDIVQNQMNLSKLIFDIRDNSGGDPNMALIAASSLMEEGILVGQMVHKNGPEHDAFTDPINLFTLEVPATFQGEVKLLCNRNSYSASSFLAGMLQYTNNVEIIGQITGGGGGDVITQELPNGWVAAVTINFFLDAEGVQIENGVIPDIELENTFDEIENGIDAILEEAINR